MKDKIDQDPLLALSITRADLFSSNQSAGEGASGILTLTEGDQLTIFTPVEMQARTETQVPAYCVVYYEIDQSLASGVMRCQDLANVNPPTDLYSAEVAFSCPLIEAK